MVRKIKVIDFLGSKFIYVNRGRKKFLFTQEELNITKERYKEYNKLK